MKQNICLGVTALLLVGGLLLPPRTEATTISNETLTNAIEKVLQEKTRLDFGYSEKNSEAVLDIAQQGSNLRKTHNLEGAQWKEDMKKPRQVRLDGRPVLGPKDAKNPR